MRNDVPRSALATRFRKGTVQDITREAMRIAADGLKARRRLDAKGEDERVFLAPIQIAFSPSMRSDRYACRRSHISARLSARRA